jgi:Tfp pilus assembly protein PilF
MRTIPRMTRPWLVVVTALLGAPAAAGCSSTPSAQSAGALGPEGSGAVPGVGDLGAPQPGQQFTISDQGSTQNIGQDRPKMNDAAAGFYTQATQAFSSGDLVSARSLYQQALQADGRAYQAHYSLGVVQERLRDAGAMESYRQSYSIVADYEPAIVAWGLLKARSGAVSEADAFLTQRHNTLPKSAAVLAGLAEVKSIAKDTGTAQKLASEALKLNPDYKPAMVVIARDHYRNRRIDLALYALQAILDGFSPVEENPPRDKENAEALLLRALIFKEQGRRADAMDQFQKAVAKRPDLVEARVQLATFLLEAGNANQALPLLEGALRFDSENLPAHLALGDCYRLQGRVAEAKQRFDYVLGRDASLHQVHYNLGLLYLFSTSVPGLNAMQQVEAATASLKKYQALRPKGESDDSDELLNRAKLRKGELEAAATAAAAPPPAPPEAGAPATPAKPDANDGSDPNEGADE